MTDQLERFAATVKRGIYYFVDSDDHGARVSTTLENTPCPRCKVTVQPNIEHLCGNRAVLGKPRGTTKPAPKRRRKDVSPT